MTFTEGCGQLRQHQRYLQTRRVLPLLIKHCSKAQLCGQACACILHLPPLWSVFALCGGLPWLQHVIAQPKIANHPSLWTYTVLAICTIVVHISCFTKIVVYSESCWLFTEVCSQVYCSVYWQCTGMVYLLVIHDPMHADIAEGNMCAILLLFYNLSQYERSASKGVVTRFAHTYTSTVLYFSCINSTHF